MAPPRRRRVVAADWQLKVLAKLYERMGQKSLTKKNLEPVMKQTGLYVFHCFLRLPHTRFWKTNGDRLRDEQWIRKWIGRQRSNLINTSSVKTEVVLADDTQDAVPLQPSSSNITSAVVWDPPDSPAKQENEDMLLDDESSSDSVQQHALRPGSDSRHPESHVLCPFSSNSQQGTPRMAASCDSYQCDQSRTPHAALLRELLFDTSSAPVSFEHASLSGSSRYLYALQEIPLAPASTPQVDSPHVSGATTKGTAYPLAYQTYYSDLAPLTATRTQQLSVPGSSTVRSCNPASRRRVNPTNDLGEV